MKRLTPVIAALAAALTLAGATHAADTPGQYTSATVSTKFELAQQCRRDLGLPVYQTRRHWETTRSQAYLAWMWRLWHKRHVTCINQTERALSDVRYAIRLIFQGPGDQSYPYRHSAAEQAIRVAWCESNWTTWNVTGQYVGVGQLGTQERADYGLGAYASPDPATAVSAGAILQVRSFYRMFVAAGRSWARWACRPGAGGETSSWVAY